MDLQQGQDVRVGLIRLIQIIDSVVMVPQACPATAIQLGSTNCLLPNWLSLANACSAFFVPLPGHKQRSEGWTLGSYSSCLVQMICDMGWPCAASAPPAGCQMKLEVGLFRRLQLKWQLHLMPE